MTSEKLNECNKIDYEINELKSNLRSVDRVLEVIGILFEKGETTNLESLGLHIHVEYVDKLGNSLDLDKSIGVNRETLIEMLKLHQMETRDEVRNKQHEFELL